MKLGLGLSLTSQRGGGAAPDTGPLVASQFTLLDVGRWPIASQAVDPPGVYDASRNVTVFSWLSEPGETFARVAELDHATGIISAPVTIGQSALDNDDHVHVTIELLSDGRYLVFYGSHTSGGNWAVSTNPGDISSWEPQATFVAQTYPRLVNYPTGGGAGVVAFTYRNASDDYEITPITYTALGTPTDGSLTELITTTGRVYTGGTAAIGSDLEMIWTFADEPDTYRRDVYYARYNLTTGEMSNLAGTYSEASPISEATADTNYKVLDVGTDKNSIPKFARDGSGNLHVTYARGSGDGAWNVYHMFWNGSVWSTPEVIGTTWEYDFTTGNSNGPDMGYIEGRIMAAWVDGEAVGFTRGGTSIVVGEYVNGAWATETVATPPVIGAFTAVAAIRNAKRGFAFMACERYASDASGNLCLYTIGSLATTWPDGLISGNRAIWNIQDLDTLWADDGVTPASVDGLVYRVDDTSGWGNHLRQATSANRPTLRQTGSTYYLETSAGDGTNDFMETATNFWQTDSGSTLLAAIRPSNLSTSPIVLGATATPQASRINAIRANSTGAGSATGYYGTAGTVDSTATGLLADGVDAVLSGSVADGGGSVQAWVDGASNGSTAMGGTPNTATKVMTFGRNRYDNTLHFHGRFYGGEAYARALTTDEREAREAVLAAMFP
jgi:hypothetical protein